MQAARVDDDKDNGCGPQNRVRPKLYEREDHKKRAEQRYARHPFIVFFPSSARSIDRVAKKRQIEISTATKSSEAKQSCCNPIHVYHRSAEFRVIVFLWLNQVVKRISRLRNRKRFHFFTSPLSSLPSPLENARSAASKTSRNGTLCDSAARRQDSYSGANRGGPSESRTIWPSIGPQGVTT